MSGNYLLNIFGNIFDFIQGDTGKMLGILVVASVGIGVLMHMVTRKTLFHVVIGTALIFGASYFATTILGITVNR